MKKAIIILISLVSVACGGEKTTADTPAMSKAFIQGVMDNDEGKINQVRTTNHSGELSSEYVLKPTRTFLKDKIQSADDLSYTLQKGKTSNVECVVVQTTDGRIGNGNNPLIHWRLKFTVDKESKKMFLTGMDQMYGTFTDKGCVE